MLDVEELSGRHDEALSIAQLYDELEGALARTFPRSRRLWVRGEIHSLSEQARTGHCFIDLTDPESAGDRQAPVLRVKCWRTTWAPMKAMLAREGIELQPGMVVLLRGTVGFWRPRAEVSFTLTDIDVTALLGRLAAQRAALLRALESEGLLGRNRRLPVPAVPVRVGLVASPESEGYRDFLGQLARSGFSFHVRLAPVAVQGAAAPRAIARGLARVADAGCDLAVVVRGGGSRADLGAFDTEPVARAIAGAPLPVWTGIGHTGDESVADIVANRSFVTPTDCGRELVAVVAAWWESVVVAGAACAMRRAGDALADLERRDAEVRGRLTGTARHLLHAHRERLGARAARLGSLGPAGAAGAAASLATRASRLGPLVAGHLAHAGDRLAGWRRLLAAYDVDRQLERGYTLTLGADGRVLRSARQLAAGSELVTRFADGSARSRVDAVELAGGEAERGRSR